MRSKFRLTIPSVTFFWKKKCDWCRSYRSGWSQRCMKLMHLDISHVPLQNNIIGLWFPLNYSIKAGCPFASVHIPLEIPDMIHLPVFAVWTFGRLPQTLLRWYWNISCAPTNVQRFVFFQVLSSDRQQTTMRKTEMKQGFKFLCCFIWSVWLMTNDSRIILGVCRGVGVQCFPPDKF